MRQGGEHAPRQPVVSTSSSSSDRSSANLATCARSDVGLLLPGADHEHIHRQRTQYKLTSLEPCLRHVLLTHICSLWPPAGAAPEGALPLAVQVVSSVATRMRIPFSAPLPACLHRLLCYARVCQVLLCWWSACNRWPLYILTAAELLPPQALVHRRAGTQGGH